MQKNDQIKVLGYLKSTFSGKALGGTFIFRRVSNIFHKNVKSVSVFTEPGVCKSYSDLGNVSTEHLVNKELWDRRMHVDCESFYGYVTTQFIRDEPNWVQGKNISFNSNKYRTFDPETLEFSLEVAKPPVPIFGDLLCIFMTDGKLINGVHTHQKQTADYWFVASEQFLRMWTAILSPYHDSLWKLLPKNTSNATFESTLRKKLFCGNQLTTNTWLKYKLMGQEELTQFTKEDSENFYWYLRVEDISKKWVDLCAVLTLVGKFGELPTACNTPTVSIKSGSGDKVVEKVYRRGTWHIPSGVLERLFKKAGINTIYNLNCVYDPLNVVKKPQEIKTETTINININVAPQQNQSVNITITKTQLTVKEQLFSMTWD
jgi:hypothetical protein